MGERFDFIDRLHARTALLAIGRSTLRNQGAPGVVDAARKYLRTMDLMDFSEAAHPGFSAALNRHTESLMSRFPGRAKGNWGAARKAINIFLRDVLYSRWLCGQYGLEKLEPLLELPLDSNVYHGLVEDWQELLSSVAGRPGDCDLPDWPGVKGLRRKVSAQLQAAAGAVAGELGTSRVHLDVRYWRKGAIDELRG